MSQNHIFRRKRSHTVTSPAIHLSERAVTRGFPVAYLRLARRVPDRNEPGSRQREAAYPTTPSRLPVTEPSRRRTGSPPRIIVRSPPYRIRIVALVPCATARAPLSLREVNAFGWKRTEKVRHQHREGDAPERRI